jgi:branched-chain amino acid transport system ATP-binding protein
VGVLLETVNVRRYFGAVRAADNLSIQLEQGQVVGIVGPNGSGKTTFVNIVTGYVKPTTGQIHFDGHEVTGLSPRELTRRGISRSFQIPQLYIRLSVLENMLIALAIRDGQQFDFWRPLKTDQRIEQALAVLDHFGFSDDASQEVATLPEGARKLLDVALSFALQPRLLLLDEPTSGVSADDKFGIMDTLMGVLRASAITTVFVEHDMEVVERYAERVLVFSDGTIMDDGPTAAVFANPEVRRHVLGEGV